MEMKKLLVLFPYFFICLCQVTIYGQKCVFDSVRSALVNDWQRVGAYTLEYIDAMPEEGVSFKPTLSCRTFAETMLHSAQANFTYAALVFGMPNPHPFDKTGLQQNDSFKVKAPLKKVVAESFAFMISALQSMKPEKLAENITWMQRTFTAETYIRRVLEHQVHMTGQCVIYLKLKNIKVPEEKLY